jgi:hypothetical protein
MPFDFKYDERTDYISKEGHYSMCKPHEATREEALLWRRVQELEELLNEECPQEVRTIVDKIPLGDSREVAMNAMDFAKIRRHARHRVDMIVDPRLNQRGILGCMHFVVDGSPSSVYIRVERGVAENEIRYGAST